MLTFKLKQKKSWHTYLESYINMKMNVPLRQNIESLIIEKLNLKSSQLRLKNEASDQDSSNMNGGGSQFFYNFLNIYKQEEVLQPKILDLTYQECDDTFTILNITKDFPEQLVESNLLFTFCQQYLVLDQTIRFIDYTTSQQCQQQYNSLQLHLTVEIAEAVSIQAIQMLSNITLIDPSQVTQIFEKLKLSYERANSKLSGLFTLQFFQFLLNNHKALIFDFEKTLFRFFEKQLSINFHNPLLVARLYLFLKKNKEIILTQAPAIFHQLFPSLLKTLAWFKNETLLYLEEFLPHIMINNSIERVIELFNSILDLPFTTLVLELQDYYFKQTDRGDYKQIFAKRYHIFVNYMKRDLSDPTYLPSQFNSEQLRVKLYRCMQDLSVQTTRIRQIQQAVFEIIICKHKCMIKLERDMFIDVLRSFAIDTKKRDIIIMMTWLIGEFLTDSGEVQCDSEDALEYFSALENVFYETLRQNHICLLKDSVIKRRVLLNFDKQMLQNQQNEDIDVFPLRLIFVLITSVTKISMRYKFLIPRAKILIQQILKMGQQYRIELIEKAEEQSNLLMNPAAATYLLNFNESDDSEYESDVQDQIQ
eukprot:403338768